MTDLAACRPLLAWAAHHGEGGAVELACAEHPGPEAGPRSAEVVRLPGCLADLPAHITLELLLLGLGVVRLRLDGCARPEEARARHRGAAVATSGARVHVELQEEARGGRRRAVLDARHMPVSRRRALLFLPVPSLQDVLPDQSATAHARLVAALRELAPPADLAAIPGPGLRLAAHGCVACGVCVRACPEDALKLTATAPAGSSPGRAVLRQEFARCSGCAACVRSCDVDALTGLGAGSWADLLSDEIVTLAEVATRACERCGGTIPAGPGAALCPVCAHRRRSSFGSALPQHLRDRFPPEVAARLAGVEAPET